jgi:uncharacterized protein (TIGR02266 family)
MTQDTRKDRRVKIVSLNVRYKSATVDEFIENHAHDVSRGGIYIKTGSPFPPGTLLKFEIRLVSDQALIMGVGRVVWKRDTSQGTGDRPAGMGVKFIKIDEPSKSVIDRLMNTRADAGRAYESEADVTVLPSEAAPSQVRAAAAGRVGKSTVLGVGSLPQPGAGSTPPTRPPGAPSSPPRPTATIAMFPKATPEAADAEPKQEQTVMKQAAELLEEALREAGGSMEDVGTNPLFAGAVQAGKASAVDRTSETSKALSSDGSGVSPSSGPEAAKARAMVAGMSPAPTLTKVTTDPPRTARESPVARGAAAAEGRPSSVRPSVRPSPLSVTSRPPPKKGSAGTLLLLGVVTAAAVAGVTFRDKLLGGGAPAEPVGTASAAQAALPSPPGSATASADLGVPSTAPAASEAPAASASAGPGASASAAAQSSMDATAASPRTSPFTPAPAFTARPAIGRSIPVPPPAAPTMGSKPLAPPSVSVGPGEPTSPALSATATAPTTATSPAPVVRPKPAAKPADDNPY